MSRIGDLAHIGVDTGAGGIVQEDDALIGLGIDAGLRHDAGIAHVAAAATRRIDREADQIDIGIVEQGVQDDLEALLVEAQSPCVHGIVDAGIGRERRPQARQRRCRQLGKLQSVFAADIRDQRGLAAGQRHHRGVAARQRVAVHRQERRRLQHLVEVAHADDTESLEKGIVQPVLAGERPGMGLHQRARLRAGAELQRDDALAATTRLCRGHGEHLRIAQRLEEQEDDLDALVLRHRGEIIGDGGDGFVACGDQVGETEVALVLAQDQRDGSALRNDAERSGLEHLHVPRRPHGDAIVHVDQAEIVGTADDDAVARGDLLDAALQVDARFVAVGIAVRIQKEGRDAAAPRLFDQVGAARRRNRKEGRIHFFRQRRQRRVAGEPMQQRYGAGSPDRSDQESRCGGDC